MLAIPEMRDTSAHAAARADFLVLSFHGNAELPAQTRYRIESPDGDIKFIIHVAAVSCAATAVPEAKLASQILKKTWFRQALGTVFSFNGEVWRRARLIVGTVNGNCLTLTGTFSFAGPWDPW